MITGDHYRAASGNLRGGGKCSVDRFERGTDLTIENWIGQMETYLLVSQTPATAWVGTLATNIAAKHYDEFKPFLRLDYHEFREKLVEVFGEADLVHARLQQLARVTQEREEEIPAYLNRVRLLVIKCHPNLSFADRERILIASFTNGLYNRQLATSLAMANPRTSADAERVAMSGEAVSREHRARKQAGNFAAAELEYESEREEDDDGGPDDSDEDACNVAGEKSSGSRPRGGSSRGRFRPRGSRTCYNCGEEGHFSNACPRPKRAASSTPIKCDLCGGEHRVRSCPQMQAAAQFVKRNLKSDAATKTTSKSTEAAHVLQEAESESEKRSPVKVVDSAMPVITPQSPARMRLFFVEGMIQTVPIWILADSGSTRNLISEATFNRLPFVPPMREPGDVRVVGGNGDELILRGFAVLPVAVGSVLLWHEFGVVPSLPLEVLIGGDVFIPHRCILHYLQNGKRQLEFGVKECEECVRLKGNVQCGAAVQMRFVDRHLRNKRNRTRLPANFVAVLPWSEEAPRPLELDGDSAEQEEAAE